MTPNEGNQLREWMGKIQVVEDAHFAAAALYQRLHYGLGLPTCILGGLVTLNQAANFSEASSVHVKIAALLISIIANGCALAVTFMNFGGRSKENRIAADGYSILKRSIEKHLARGNGQTAEFVDRMEAKWAELQATTPTIPDRIYAASARNLSQAQEWKCERVCLKIEDDTKRANDSRAHDRSAAEESKDRRRNRTRETDPT